MIIRKEEWKKRMKKLKNQHKIANLYTSLYSFEVLSTKGEDPMWAELRDYTKSLIHELEIQSEVQKFPLV